MTKETKKREAVSAMLIGGKTVSVYLADDCQFYTTVAGKKYSAPSLKQLQSVASKVSNDTAFDPQRLELGSLDTARRHISGKYEDNLRTGHVSITYEDEKDCYEMNVSVSGKSRRYSAEFNAASEVLVDEIMAEVRNRLSSAEWRATGDTKRDRTRRHWQEKSSRAQTTEQWINPRQHTRKTASELQEAAAQFLVTEYDLELVESKGVRFSSDSVTLQMKNGQQFKLEMDEEY